jgi:hypothetical protein
MTDSNDPTILLTIEMVLAIPADVVEEFESKFSEPHGAGWDIVGLL